MRNPLGEKWLHFLKMLLLLPNLLYGKELSQRSIMYLNAFEAMFPDVDVHTAKVFDFVSQEDHIKKVMLLNGLSCRVRHLDKKDPRVKRAVKSAYDMMGLPIDIMYSTPLPPPGPNTDTDSLYGYIPQSFYDNLNLTSSELAISKEGWDYSPYIPPGETTTEFIFPSWNYEGHVPVAFWKDWTNHEMDLQQSTYQIPDNVNGYTDKEHPKINTFEEFYDAFWDTLYSIPHRCDKYPSIWACLQGKEIMIPNQLDGLDDPVDKK